MKRTLLFILSFLSMLASAYAVTSNGLAEESVDKYVKATLEGKISSCWYNLDGSQGNEAIAMKMEEPKIGAQIIDNTNWSFDLLTVFTANQLNLSVTGTDASDVAAEIVFEEKNGYTISSDGKTLYYENSPIATLNTSILTMVKNEKSMSLINDRASSKMKDALKLPLRVKATYNDKEIPVEDGSFTVYVMRPISVEGQTIEGIDVYVLEDIIQIIDLVKIYYGEDDNNTFKSVVDSNSGEIDMYKYYGVKSITITGVTQPSDIYDVVKSNKWNDPSVFRKFNSITTQNELVYNPTDYDCSINAGISNISYGTLSYINNAGISSSSLKIPVTVTYAWGTIQTTAYVNVGFDTSCFGTEKDDGVINVPGPGVLKCYITDVEKYDIDKLIITGQLNGTDIKLLRDMAGNSVNGVPTEGKLTELDLSGASIVTGGEKYIDVDETRLGDDYGLIIAGGCHFNVESDNEIGKYAFIGCHLKNVILPISLTKLSEGVFSECSDLTSVTIGSKVNSIGQLAFQNCKKLKDVYCYAENVPNTQNDAFLNANFKYVTLHVPDASVSAYQAAEPWKNFKKIVALSYQGNDTDDDDYIPFVDFGKNWMVVRSSFDPDKIAIEEYIIPLGTEAIVNLDGKSYYKMKVSKMLVSNYVSETVTYFLREENRKVYLYDPNRKIDFLLFDYSLKEGDTYETFSYEEEKMVSYKVLSVSDYTEGPEMINYDNRTNNWTTQHRNLRKWTVCRTDNELLQKNWIEGIGSFEGPFHNLNETEIPDLTRDYLAYVFSMSNMSKHYYYIPFSFRDTLNKQVYGCNMPTGAESNEKDEWGRHHLSYELEDNRLHVYGDVFTQCGPNNYAYFIEKPTDDPFVHKIEFKIQEIPPQMDCMALHATDFYVPGSFDPNINYIVVDNHGEEHPVINKTQQMAYRPMIEDGKVWKVGYGSHNPIQFVEYYYFDSDTIIGGKTSKQMMCQRYVNPEYPDYDIVMKYPLLQYVGAWYEEDKKVYFYNAIGNKMLMYDFSVGDNATLQIQGQSYLIGPKQSGMKGFKGIYRDVMMLWDEEQNTYNTTWLEGVGGIEGPKCNVYYGEEYHGGAFLMSCTVGDEVIYLNDEYEDGATPDGVRKRRFDFTHTIKTQPKARNKSGVEKEQSPYGEYNEQRLGINLDPLEDAYQVRITDETGQTVYEKAIDAGNIVGLNIDISAYAEGRYTVTVENSQESFIGEFETQTTGIEEVNLTPALSHAQGVIYNLHGQRLSTLQKGLNIVNGQKVFVK